MNRMLYKGVGKRMNKCNQTVLIHMLMKINL